jgi:hypothetical protein
MAKRQSRPPDDGASELGSIADRLGVGSRPPMRTPSGDLDPEHFRWAYTLLDRMIVGIMQGEIDPPRNFNPEQYRKVFNSYCMSHGFDPRHLQDARTEAEKLLDAVRQLVEAPHTVLEIPTDIVNALAGAMEAAVKECGRQIDAQIDEARLASVGKGWRHLLEKLARCQEMARQPLPSRVFKGDAAKWRASHLLRHMLYIFHRGTASEADATAMMKITPHLCKMAVDIWEAEEKVAFTAEGVQYGAIDYEGVILTCPPGHWKTTILTAWISRRTCRRKRTQGIVLHAIADKAEEILQSVKFAIDNKTATGRRCRALYPHLRLADKDNNQSKMRLRDDNPTKSPTLMATGVTNKGLGSDADFIAIDDAVPQEDAHQETERKRRQEKIGGTWLSRRRKTEDVFVVWIGNTWHPADAMMHHMKLAGQQKIKYRVSIQRCGGPAERFKPLCPDAMSAADLRAMYHVVGPALYAAAYECRPMAEGRQIVSKLRYYDPSDEQHGRFLNGAQFIASGDPAATSRDKSDRAGIAYCAIGEVSWTEADESGQPVHKSETRLRFLGFDEIKARPADFTEYIMRLMLEGRPVDTVLVETVGGFTGIIDDFDRRFGVSAIPISTANRSKEMRLKSASPALDDERFGPGGSGPGAVVEFPGLRREDGTVGPDPELQKFYDQILSFGATEHDHTCDAITQAVNWAIREDRIKVGSGEISRRVVRYMQEDPQRERLKRFVAELRSGGRESRITADQEDMACFGATWN